MSAEVPTITIPVEVKWDSGALSKGTRSYLIRYGKLTKSQIEMLWPHMSYTERLWCCKARKVSEAFIEKHWEDFWHEIETIGTRTYIQMGDWDYLLRTNRVSSSFVVRRWDSFNRWGKVTCLINILLPKQFVLQHWGILGEKEQVQCWRAQEFTSRLRERDLPMFLTGGNASVRKSAKRLVQRFEAKKSKRR